MEAVRKEAHTLDEHHEHVLSASFDMSFSNNVGQGPSSSQTDVPFDNFFPFLDGLDVGEGLGDDLARELGWATSPIKSVCSNRYARIIGVLTIVSDKVTRYRIAANVEKERPPDFQFDNEGDLNTGGMDFDFNMGDMGMFMDEPTPIMNEDRQSTPAPQQASKRAKVRNFFDACNFSLNRCQTPRKGLSRGKQ